MKIDKITSEAAKHHLIAGVLCLDFSNTLYGHDKTPIHEYIADYNNLVIWSHKAGILTDRDVAFLIRKAAIRPHQAQYIFHRAIAFRETIHRFFKAIAHNERPKSADLVVLDSARTNALEHTRIFLISNRFSIDWIDKTALDRMLWPIALSAMDLLTSSNLSQVRQCSGCDWLFIDQSRNHLRRWCSMSVCGNRAKARRFLDRKRKLVLKLH